MPDIAMCSNKKCKLKESCYRFKAIPCEWQSYSKFKPVKDRCEYFIEVLNTDLIKENNE